MLWFIILSGVTSTSPLRQTFFLRADTSGITGARPISQWTYFFICGPDNTNCGSASPALPLGSAWGSHPRNAPEELVGNYGDNTTSFTYWYMWRFGWVFFILALFFEVVTFFSGFLACCSRLGSAISGMIALTALLFYSVAVALMTYVYTAPNDIDLRNVLTRTARTARHLSRQEMLLLEPDGLPSSVPGRLDSPGVVGRHFSLALSYSASRDTPASSRARRPLLPDGAAGRASGAPGRMRVAASRKSTPE